jgi:methionyl-tRNA formyltransferase
MDARLHAESGPVSASGRLKIVFMGTPGVAVAVMEAVIDAGHDVIGVYTRPDRPAGRGRRPVAPEVKRSALDRGIPVFQPASLRRDEEARRHLVELAPDVIVVAAYGLFLPADILESPPLRCLNVHPSLLPRHRGPSPVATAVLDGDEATGVTVMRLDEGMDTGPLVAQRETAIGPEETAEKLTARLFRMGADLLVETLPRWARGEVQARSQDEAQATVTMRLSREDGKIDWDRPAAYTARQVRAYFPWPGTFTHWRGRLLKVLEASALDQDPETSLSEGQVASLDAQGVGVATGDGILGLRRVQLEGRRPVSAAELRAGHPDFIGSVLGSSVV